MRVVEDVIASLGAADTPRIEVYNKIDAAADAITRPDGSRISARTGRGVPELLARVEELLTRSQVKVELVIPYDRYEVMQQLHTLGTVLSEEHEADGTHVTALLDEDMLWKIKKSLDR